MVQGYHSSEKRGTTQPHMAGEYESPGLRDDDEADRDADRGNANPYRFRTFPIGARRTG